MNVGHNCNIYYKFPFSATILGSFPTINTFPGSQFTLAHLLQLISNPLTPHPLSLPQHNLIKL